MNWLSGATSVEAQRWVAQLADPVKRERATLELLRMGYECAPALIEALQSREPGLPLLVGELLVRLGAFAVPALIHSLHNDPPEIRIRVPALLAQIKDPQVAPALMQALSGEYYTVRRQAAHALGTIASPQALPALLDVLKDPEEEVREAAVLAVGVYCDPRTFDPMADLLLDDPALAVRQAAAKALGETRHEEAVPFLLEALGDSFWWYEREGVVDGLLRAIETLGQPAVEALILALKDPEGTVRRYAALLLGRVGDPRAVEPLGMALYDMHSEVGQAAAQALAGFGEAGLEHLVEALGHPEAWIRQHAVRGLALSGDERALPVLLDMLDDPDREVVKLVIPALGALGDERVLAALEPIAAQRADRELSSLARETIKRITRSLPG